MTGAMYAAVAGLKTHMQNLNVIGNNIANINTNGYKAGRAVFQTALYSQIRSGSDGSTTVGARNPSQLGYGVSVGTVDIDMSTGSYNPTGKPTDCMLDGDGFFLFGDKTIAENIDPSDPSTLTALTLSRVGDVEFKSDGYLNNHNGDSVYGFLCIGTDADGKPIFSDQLVPIRYPRIEEVYTDKDGNPYLNTNGEALTWTQLTTGDTAISAEAQATAVKSFRVRYPIAYEGATPTRPKPVNPDADPNDPNAALPQGVRLQDAGIPAGADESALKMASFDTVTFDENTGIISGTCKETNQVVVIGMFAVGNVTNPNGVTQISNTQYKAGSGSGDMTICTIGNAGADYGIDYVNGSMFRQETDADGNPVGDGTQSDGMRVKTAGTTKIMSGGLEQSKTDLATEIANMITTQRGYQANTRIITVTDSMLEELVNMKR